MKISFNNIPLKITAARLFTSPLLVLLFWMSLKGSGYGSTPEELVRDLKPGLMLAAFILLLLQQVSDMVDGYIARKHKVVTNLGKLADPLADTIANFGAYLCLMWVGLIPFWLLFVMYVRESSVSTLRILAAHEGVVVAARLSGKLKSLSLAIGADILFIVLFAAHYYPGVPVEMVANVISWLIGIIMVVSLFDYYFAITRIRAKSRQE
ncbi:MAG TPA: CDP-diacylglycerol--glycerol-3-phosphate 3-phosphatidyltransferase [Myxococcota bacterium]|nr:CDP-diacylglycerol--glycerol-3-phosphate 3-phosphatidyltransferase [Myxococcota bacterium]HOA14520.1 CDP-diacylglycerol--glycerol-3-phosphate 3-phosphatidyltransferase [Myxococcota bacterium]HOC99140.1 CDP-diacylglycerol--glycerol-3-phosphate 3-phosphatidyltransferase [Myxococcota bacterium]HOH77858.1 CDP-diacylglycerol--glycerol-3-phosphate 3-phosphatidyltransferase [Myxococcota bacterium]HPV04055.1 CDP-diacylglycerol--glycerol-3-phosphate 3-phosphatidyltransferase [Myxococcota bacterium]